MTVTSVLKAAMNFNDMIIDSVKFITQDNVRKGEVFEYSRIDIHAHILFMILLLHYSYLMKYVQAKH